MDKSKIAENLLLGKTCLNCRKLYGLNWARWCLIDNIAYKSKPEELTCENWKPKQS